MFPSKSMLDYVSEMNRLFPKTSENDVFQSSSIHTSSIQSTPVRLSSSSTDSTTPDSFTDVSLPFTRLVPELYRITETPQVSGNMSEVSRRRPIIGRKIMVNTECSKPVQVNKANEHDAFANAMWMEDISRTPPNAMLQYKKPAQFYELFPSKDIGCEFQSPGKYEIASSFSPVFSNLPSGMSNISPHSSEVMAHFKPRHMTPSSFGSASPPSFSGASSSKIDEIGSQKMCTFCKKNGETPLVYMTHMVKEKIGNQNIVTCPILRSHVCSTCGATGDKAHTITYCPVLRSRNNGKRPQSTTVTLKNTRIMSNGKRRY